MNRMTAAFIGKLVTLLLANSMLVSVTYALKQRPTLEKCLANFKEAHLKLDAKAQLAERFCKQVGDGRSYKFVLKLDGIGQPDLALLRQGIFKIKDLSMTSDADAAIEVLLPEDPKKLWYTRDMDEIVAELKSAVDSQLVPACQSLVDALKEVYYGNYIVVNEASLEEEIRDIAGRNAEERHEVDRFIYGWAHVHFCKVLLSSEGGTEGIKKKVPGRFDFLKRRLRRKIEASQADSIA